MKRTLTEISKQGSAPLTWEQRTDICNLLRSNPESISVDFEANKMYCNNLDVGELDTALDNLQKLFRVVYYAPDGEIDSVHFDSLTDAANFASARPFGVEPKIHNIRLLTAAMSEYYNCQITDLAIFGDHIVGTLVDECQDFTEMTFCISAETFDENIASIVAEVIAEEAKQYA